MTTADHEEHDKRNPEDSGEIPVVMQLRKHDLGRRTLWTSLGICLGGISVGFWLHYAFHARKWDIGGQIALHCAMGFLVAAILMVTIEFNAKRFTHREIRRFLDLVSRDVFEALLGRIVPRAVFDEMNSILHGDVVRSDCEYFITFHKPSEKMAPGYFIIRRDVLFKVRNLLQARTTFWVRSSHSSEEDPASAAWRNRQFHTELKVDGKDVPKEEQKIEVRDGVTVLEHAVKLGPRQSVRIFLRGEEPCRLDAGRNSYIQATPVVGIRVTIANDHTDVIGSWDVRFNHPAWWNKPDKGADEAGRYVLDRAFLPGQGFEVLWRSTLDQEKLPMDVEASP